MSKAVQPNIVFIMADDHASKAIGCYGYGINATPNMDRLAREGLRANHCYVTNSICTPSRAAILTGTYNHVNGVMTLADSIDNRLPNVAKHLRHSGYQTAIFGKWHLGEGRPHEPSGFDAWAVVPGQGDYHDPLFHEPGGERRYKGYVTDIITDMSIDWMAKRDTSRPFFLMCHHKAPHRSWEPHPKYRDSYKDPIKLPDTFDDDYKNRAKAASAARMRIADDMTYLDLGLVQPDGGSEVGELLLASMNVRKLPKPKDVRSLRLIDKDTGEVFTFASEREYDAFKFQRYMQRYLRTIASVDESVGRILDFLDANGLGQNTLVIYTSDQGFFLGEHGWFDKRFMYEESFQMPFLARYPAEIPAGTVSNDIFNNVDFAPTWLDLARATGAELYARAQHPPDLARQGASGLAATRLSSLLDASRRVPQRLCPLRHPRSSLQTDLLVQPGLRPCGHASGRRDAGMGILRLREGSAGAVQCPRGPGLQGRNRADDEAARIEDGRDRRRACP